MEADEIEASDIADCMDDWMEENFSVIADEKDHQQIGDTLVQVREELTYCAMEDYDLMSGSVTLQKLQDFNVKNRGNVIEINKATQNSKVDSSDEDDDSGWSSDSDDEDGGQG